MLRFYNSLSGKLEDFVPMDLNQVRMYVCGPTVYDFIHLGNARSAVVFDMLYRVLQTLYPSVIYVQNLTDIDDKIINRARHMGISEGELTKETIKNLKQDMVMLNVLEPTHNPKATDYVDKMLELIKVLIEDGYAYYEDGHVLFSTQRYELYGCLSKKNRDELIYGARVEVAPYKRDATDFVLWKPSKDGELAFDSPYGKGRPGWHIECSAMSYYLLGAPFDIHGGGRDLIFPHHENESAQSCAFAKLKGRSVANYWVHNEMLVVNGQKMSKSLNNFTTLREALHSHKGEILRWFLLSSSYKSVLDYNEDTLHEARVNLDRIYRCLGNFKDLNFFKENLTYGGINNLAPHYNIGIIKEALEIIYEDLNTPLFFKFILSIVNKINVMDSNLSETKFMVNSVMLLLDHMGFLKSSSEGWFKERNSFKESSSLEDAEIERIISMRHEARRVKDFKLADDLRRDLFIRDVLIEDRVDGSTLWRRK